MNCETEVISACKECGGSGVLMRNPDGTHFIRCAQCSASSCDYPEIQDAIYWWNTDNSEVEADKADVSVIIYNLYWYAERNAANYQELCKAIQRYCNVKE